MPVDPFGLVSIFESRSKIAKTIRIPTMLTIFLVAGVAFACFFNAKQVVPISIGSSIAGLIAGIIWHIKAQQPKRLGREAPRGDRTKINLVGK